MAETEFEKWLAMKNSKRKKPSGRVKGKELNPNESLDLVSKLAKQPMTDPKELVKHQIATGKLRLEGNIIVYQDPNTTKPIETNSGTAQTSAKNAMKRLRSRRRRELRKREGSLKK